MTITPLDIRQHEFKTRFRGFDRKEVASFLESMSAALESMQVEKDNFRKEIKRLKLESQGYKEREETFKRAMLNSQKVIEQMKENAQKKAELIVAEAEVKAEKILNRAHNRLAQLHEDIAELKRQRMQIEVQIRGVIESHMKLLDMGHEEAQTADESDTKIKVFNQR